MRQGPCAAMLSAMPVVEHCGVSASARRGHERDGCDRTAKGCRASVALQCGLGPLQPCGIVATRVAGPVLGIVDDAGEQAARLLAVVGLRLCHQPFGVEAASGRVIPAFHGTLERGAGAGRLGGCQCLRVEQGLFRLAAHICVAGEQAVQRLHRKRGVPGIEAGTGEANGLN